MLHDPPIAAAQLLLSPLVGPNLQHADDIAFFDEPSALREHVKADAQRRAVPADELLGTTAAG